MNCKDCIYFNSTSTKDGEISHKDFGFCKKLVVHEGEMRDAKNETNFPDENINIIVCTSEWFQSLTVNENFGCILFEQK